MPKRLFRLFFGDLAFFRVVIFVSVRAGSGFLEGEGGSGTSVGKEDFGEREFSGGEANNDCKVSTLSGLNLLTVLFSFRGVVSCLEVSSSTVIMLRTLVRISSLIKIRISDTLLRASVPIFFVQ